MKESFHHLRCRTVHSSDFRSKLGDQRQRSGRASVVGGGARALLCDLDLKSTLLTSFISFELNDLKHISASKRSIYFQMDTKKNPSTFTKPQISYNFFSCWLN